MSTLTSDWTWTESTSKTIDKIYITDVKNHFITGSDSDDSLEIHAPKSENETYDLDKDYGNQNIYFNAGDGYDTLDYTGLTINGEIAYNSVSVTATGATDYSIVITGGDRKDLNYFDSLDVYIQNVEYLSLTNDADTVDLSGLTTQVDITIDAGQGDDVMVGSDYDDIFWGGDGDDTMTGGLGDDQIFGGDGTDTVIYDGDFDDYTFYYDSDEGIIEITGDSTSESYSFGGNTYTVSETYTDTVSTDVEYFEFNGETYSINDILIEAGSAPLVSFFG